jgi:hypothetical protein
VLGFLPLLIAGTIWQSDSSFSPDSFFTQTYLNTSSVFHTEPEVLFTNRPQHIDLFVEFDKETLESVRLYFRTNSTNIWQEIHLGYFRGRYRYLFDPNIIPGIQLEYFFIVTLKDFSIYAEPLDENGMLSPIKKPFLDPVKYYKAKLKSKQ